MKKGKKAKPHIKRPSAIRKKKGKAEPGTAVPEPYVETRCWPQTDEAGFSYPYLG